MKYILFGKIKEESNLFFSFFYTPNQVYLFKREKQFLLLSLLIPYFPYKKSKDFFLKISRNFFYIPENLVFSLRYGDRILFIYLAFEPDTICYFIIFLKIFLALFIGFCTGKNYEKRKNH